MTAKDRNDMLYALIHNYVLDKRRNQVFMRENDSSYMHSMGMLMGACMALGYEVKEFENCIRIQSQKSGRVILTVMKDEF